MYLPNHFEAASREELFRTIAAYPFGSLVAHGPNGLDANHVPFLIDEASGSSKLLAHVARANPLWKEAKDGDEVLVIFRADDAYVSPNWYPSKHEFHKGSDVELPRRPCPRKALHPRQREICSRRCCSAHAHA